MTGVPPTGETEEGDNQALLALEVVATIAVEDSSQVRSGGPELAKELEKPKVSTYSALAAKGREEFVCTGEDREGSPETAR